MKSNTSILITIAILMATACNFSASISKDFMTGISTKGNGISAEEVYLSDGTNGLKKRTFKYGEKIFTNFSNLKGFTIEDGVYYPNMNVLVTSKKGDTLMSYTDLYESRPIDASDNTLNGHVVLANPIRSGEEYTITYNLSDAKGDGRFSSEMEFKVIPDPSIEVTKSGFDFDEVYIMNNDDGTVITDHTIGFNQNIFFNFQGLSGYTINEDKAEIGLKVSVTDDDGNVIIDEPDVFEGQQVRVQDLQQGIASTIILTPGSLSNPLKWEVDLWDKNSGAKLRAQTEITVKK